MLFLTPSHFEVYSYRNPEKKVLGVIKSFFLLVEEDRSGAKNPGTGTVGCGIREAKGGDVELPIKLRVTGEISKILAILRTLLVH